MSLLRRTDPETGREEVRPAVRVAGYVVVLAVAVAWVVAAIHYVPPPDAAPATTHVGDIEPPCGVIDDCDRDGVPDDLEDDLRREQQAQLAYDYCTGTDYEGGSEACFEDVANGSLELDPVDVYGPPNGEPQEDYNVGRDYP